MIEQAERDASLLALGVKPDELPWARAAAQFAVDGWGAGPSSPPPERPAGAPAWYAGDEVESQRMLAALGLRGG
jgi:hypothetical protein